MVEVIPNQNLVFNEYQAALDQVPSNIYYQRVSSRNVSRQQASFTVSNPGSRDFLLTNPAIQWQFTFRREQTSATFVPNGTADDYADDRDLATLKPVLPVANAINNINLTLNGSSINLSQPRHIMECLSMLHVSREEARIHYEAGYPEKMGGQINRSFPSVQWANLEDDDTYNDQYYDFASRLLRGVDVLSNIQTGFGVGATQILNNGIMQVTEPVITPPFDCFYKVDHSKMPMWSPWKTFSRIIPNIDRLTIDIAFTKLDASLHFYLFGRTNQLANRPPALTIPSTVGSVKADLLLYWATPPVSYSIPASIDLPSWDIREFQDSVTTPADNVFTNSISSLIQLSSVPSIIITHLETDKDSVNYQPSALFSQSNTFDAAAANLREGGAVTNWDFYGEILGITYLLGDRPNVITSVSFSQRELYDLTVKNSGNKFPYTFDDWRGRTRPEYENGTFLLDDATDVIAGVPDLSADWVVYGCKGMVAVTAADIANRASPGVFTSTSLQIKIDWRPHGSFAGSSPGNGSYIMYNHLIFGRSFVRVERFKSEYQNQSLDEAVARRLTDPPLSSMTVPGNTAGAMGSASSGGTLGTLRNRGVSAIGSRL